MANTNSKDKIEARNENIQETVTSASKFLEDNKKSIISVLVAVVVVALLCLAYNKFIYQAKVDEALEAAYPAEALFQNGEYELALNGSEDVMGFAEIISEYGAKAGKSMPFYAGICEYQLGNYEQAIEYLKKYKGTEPILAARAKACEGDANVGLGQYEAAVACFKAAVAKADNIFAAAYLLKQGLAHEALNQKAEALNCYKTIQEKYPQSIEAYDITKFIARIAE